MPNALLLSPDDQAVSAITGVLEEMSVSCERPLDGVSAAQKLNSQSFDLVLVDCENLPAAKLIFDVCRRGKNGINPVPIAIVDGRAGLPTAFRLGAELILTKPVAKDQARSTIRTAVSRLRKDEPARAAQTLVSGEPAPPAARMQAAAAAASSQPGTFSEVTSAPPVDAPPAPPSQLVSSRPSAADDLFAPPTSAPPTKHSDDPVPADLGKRDVTPAPALVFSSYKASPPKRRGPVVALLILAILGGGFYAAWMYQPGFRELLQPQIDRVLALIGIAPQQKVAPASSTPVPVPSPPIAKPSPATSAAPPPASPADATQPDGSSPAASSPDAAPENPTTEPAATPPATAPPTAEKSESPARSRKTGPPASSISELPTDNAAVILSSKGAEKRLVHHVPPNLPKGTTAQAQEGTVVLKTAVDNRGRVESVHLVEGNPALAEAAMHAVKQWRYRPYVRDGKNLPFQTLVLVDFQHH